MQAISGNDVFPAFSSRNIPIACSCSNKYVPFLLVFLQSIIEHASPEYNYDILIFQKSISSENKEILSRFFMGKNRSIRFINPTNLLDFSHLYCHAHYAPECYFRLASPLILTHYEKIIFTDIDLVFQQDPKELYKIPLQDKPIAACLDLAYSALLNYPKFTYREYCRTVLQLDNPFTYYNTGVMLINIDVFNKHSNLEQLFQNIKNKQYQILEQDALNEFFKDNILYLDPAWNVPTNTIPYKTIGLFSYMPSDYQTAYNRSRENPFIIHWAGSNKPWDNLQEDWAYIWWKYARKTPFYEYMFQKMLVRNMLYIKQCLKKLERYRLLAHICWGKRKTHYIRKIKIISNTLSFYQIDSIKNAKD